MTFGSFVDQQHITHTVSQSTLPFCSRFVILRLYRAPHASGSVNAGEAQVGSPVSVSLTRGQERAAVSSSLFVGGRVQGGLCRRERIHREARRVRRIECLQTQVGEERRGGSTAGTAVCNDHVTVSGRSAPPPLYHHYVTSI